MALDDPEGALREEAALRELGGHTLIILQRLVREPDLHARRVAATLNAVRSRVAANGDRDAIAESPAQQAAGLIALDLHGLGGRAGCCGGATLRMPWARGLGRGRWKAYDGNAHRDAARSAIMDLMPEGLALFADRKTLLVADKRGWDPQPLELLDEEQPWALAYATHAALYLAGYCTPSPALDHVGGEDARPWARLAEALSQRAGQGENP